MARYHVEIDNQWTRPKPGFARADLDQWQVGFFHYDTILLAGFYDHVIASETKLHNMSGPIQKRFWPPLLLALGQGYQFLHGPSGLVARELPALRQAFGRWGRDPDEVAEWMLFTNQRQVPHAWWQSLNSDNSPIGLNINALGRLLQETPAVVVWALDGHLYGGFADETEQRLRTRIAPIEAQIGFRAARYHELIMAA